MFQFRESSRGVTALWNDKQLTSAYAPEREARAWAAGVAAEAGSLVFVAGDPWGLASQALSDRGLRAIALMPGPEALSRLPAGVEAWAPGTQTLEEFLQDVFEETGPEGVVWEVWPAFERWAPEVVLDWSRRFRDLFRAVQGSWLTHRRFGPRLWKNALRNFVGWEHRLVLEPGTRPIVIAASGPSLDEGWEVLSSNRHRFDLWALPSSFETLVCRDLVPDVGVATDGGFYAREHLQRLASTQVPVLAALSSAPDPVLETRPCLFFGQGLPIEQALLASRGSTVQVPSQGTVAVTALRLALAATTGPVFIAGLDLSFRGYRGHTSPHTVDRRLGALGDRLTPPEGLWAQRFFEQATVVHEGLRTSPAMVTYAQWFRSRARFARSVFRIAPSALHWDSMSEVSWNEAQAMWRGSSAVPVRWVAAGSSEGKSGRREAARRVLADLEERVRHSPPDRWMNELARTAVPEALAEDFRAARRGLEPGRVKKELPEFLASLSEPWR